MDIGILIGIIGLVIGVPSFFIAFPDIKNWFKSLSGEYFILLYGPKNSGKTTLLRYLDNKKLPIDHYETIVESSGKIIYDLKGKNPVYFKAKKATEIGGEHSSQLPNIFKRDNPHGVLMIFKNEDYSSEKNKLIELIEFYKQFTSDNSEARLKSLYIFVNKCDIWGDTTPKQYEITQKYKCDLLKKEIDEFKKLVNGLDVDILATSFTNVTYKSLTDEALRRFAKSLEEN